MDISYSRQQRADVGEVLELEFELRTVAEFHRRNTHSFGINCKLSNDCCDKTEDISVPSIFVCEWYAGGIVEYEADIGDLRGAGRWIVIRSADGANDVVQVVDQRAVVLHQDNAIVPRRYTLQFGDIDFVRNSDSDDLLDDKFQLLCLGNRVLLILVGLSVRDDDGCVWHCWPVTVRCRERH